VHGLFQVASYALYCAGGLAALVVAKCLLVASGAFLLAKAVEREAGRRAVMPFAAVFIAALFATRSLLLLRPVLVTLVLLAAFFVRLERFRRQGRWSALLPLPLLAIVWSNCQGLFALGPALVGAYLVGGWATARFEKPSPTSASTYHPSLQLNRGTRLADCQTRDPGAAANDRPTVPSPRLARDETAAVAVTLLLCVLACFVTPYGLRAALLPLELFSRLLPGHTNVYAANVVENAPPLSPAMAGQFWHLRWFFGFLVVSFAVAGRRLVLSHALIVAALVVLALLGNRNVLLLYWLATPIAVMNAWRGARRLLATARQRSAVRTLVRWGPAVACAATLAFAFTTAWNEPWFGRVAPFRAPTQSARILRDRPGTGTIFAADEYGGYLIWNLFPRYRPYMDTRLVLRTAAEFAEYLDMADRPDRFDAFQQTHAFDYVILPVMYPDRYLGLIAHLHASPQWKLVFTDGAETLFAKREDTGLARIDLGSAAHTDRILRALDEQFGTSARLHDAALTGLATLEMTLREYGEAERVLGVIASPEALALRARNRLAAGDLLGARSLGEQALKADRDDVRNLNLMALVSLRLGEPASALVYLRRSLSADPFDVEAERILSSLEEHADAHRD
jgi:hypothetical protein